VRTAHSRRPEIKILSLVIFCLQLYISHDSNSPLLSGACPHVMNITQQMNKRDSGITLLSSNSKCNASQCVAYEGIQAFKGRTA